MNISLGAHAASGAPGTHGKSVKSGDPLADFMALLTQLGITVEEDGTLAASTTTTATPVAQDIAAKLFAKLGKNGEQTLPQPKPEAPASEAGTEEPKQDDPVATLASLLAQIDPAASQDAASPAPDVATLIAAVRAFVANEVRPAGGTTPVDPGTPKSNGVTATSAPSIAALLARAPRAGGDEKTKPIVPGAVQSAFVRLEKLVSTKPAATDSAEGEPAKGDSAEGPTKTGKPALTDRAEAKPLEADDATASDAQVPDRSPNGEKSASATRLTELLARLTASVKPGAGRPQAATDNALQTHAARPPVDPQIAALAQAIQNVAQDDRPTSETADPSSSTSPSLAAIAAPATPANAPARADALPTNVTQTAPSEELVKHHLDLARDTQWLDTLARDIARAAQSNTHLRFQLNPEHLGSLKVELLNGANGTSVKLTADTEAARAILADAQPRLVAEARAQGLRISEAHVDLGGHGGGHRPMAETPVMIRTANGAPLAEVEQDKPAASGERYA